MQPDEPGRIIDSKKKERRIYLLSRNLKNRWANYLWQSMAAGILTFFLLYVFVEIIALIILAGVGSTVFTVFALPWNRTASTRNIIGSYMISIAVGYLSFYITSPSISGSVAVGLSTLLMVITDTEHPPAAGVALGLALTGVYQNLLPEASFALVGALVAVVLRNILSPWLKDLI